MLQSLLYLSESTALDMPLGPGVNERDFACALQNCAKEDGRGLDMVFPLEGVKTGWKPVPAGSLPGGQVAKTGLNPDNCFVFSLPNQRPRALPGTILSAFRTASWLARLMQARGHQAVVLRMGHMPFLSWFLATRFQVPVILKTAGEYRILTPPVNLADRKLGQLQEYLSEAVIRRAVAVDTVSWQQKKVLDIVVSNKETLFIEENAVDIRKFFPQSKPETYKDIALETGSPVLGFVGTFPYIRGARQMLEAANILKQKYPDIKLFVAGPVDEPDKLNALANEYGLSKNLHLFGKIPYDEVPLFLSCVDIGFAYDDAERAAKIGNSSQKIRQYLACGIPVISLPVGNDFLDDNDMGSRIPGDNINMIAKETEKWIERRKNEGKSLSERLREFSEKDLSFDASVRRRLMMWDSIFDKGVPSGENLLMS